MAHVWQLSDAATLIKALRPGGNCWGESPAFARFITLNKTDLISDLRRENPKRHFCWRISGDASATGKYAPSRRSIIIWLGDTPAA